MSRKRNRNNFTRRSTPRPIDKNIKIINIVIGSSTSIQALVVATFPCTIVGLRWEVSYTNDTANTSQFVRWAIVLLRDGELAGSLGSGNLGTLYTPEQNVMAFGAMIITGNSFSEVGRHESGSTKTMRKLMGGDKIVFLAAGTSANGASVTGAIQFFCKS